MAEELLRGSPEIVVERDVPCRVRDGVTLFADVYYPAAPGPHPVLLMREPYDKATAQTGSGYAHPNWWARRGYLTVVQDCRGRFRSEGEFFPFAQEAVDGYDAVEWAARLPAADGRVAMYGFSYPGATQLLAATERPPSLIAIVPGMTGSQYYEGWTYNGGALALAFAVTWACGLAFDSARRHGDAAAMAELEAAYEDASLLSRLPLVSIAQLTRRHAPYFLDWLKHESYDDYWRSTSIAEDYGRIDVPGLHFAGWYDIFLGGTVENFVGLQRLTGTQKLLIGPWQHGPWAPLGPWRGDIGSGVVNDWQLRFLEQVVRGRDTGVFDAPVTAFVLGDGWRDLDGWPPSRTRSVEYFLHSDGRANSAHGDGSLSTEPPGAEPPDVFVYDPLAPVLGRGGHSCCSESIAPMGPASQRETERWSDLLVYTSAPLERDLELIGDVRVTLYAASTAVDTDFTARLCLVDEAGESINLEEGIIRARYRDSLSQPSPLEPGRVYAYRIALGPVGIRVAPGQRLRLQVASSDFPQWDRNLNTGGPLGEEGAEKAIVATQTVLHDSAYPSRVTLPVFSP